ncbi:MAG TPA: D-alanyl-D-alanine carboxypeptidase/D-alanyl-D-alanine-endopeptidase [Thermoanaerobaculia bacterium]|jgi:D-alanyl-D-alanine carboxypeptidase/D-alanyl-D-alanine-endopeptidase (penicillin-binding protein 4)
MTSRLSRPFAILAVFILLLADSSAYAQQKKKTTTRRKAAPARKAPAKKPAVKPAAAPALATAVGVSLEERLASLVNSAVARGSDSSIQIAEVESGRVVGQRNPNLALSPASNMKLFTTAAAIDILKPTFEVTTAVYVRGAVDPTGTLDGDVKVVGRGDPTIGGRFHDGNATAVINEWAADLKRSGIKTVRGNLIFEYGYFDTDYIHPTWPRDQLVNWYEAPVSAFSMQEGCVEVRVLPSQPGQPCVVQFEPPTSYLQVENNCRTGRGLPFITRHLNSNKIIVRGGVPARSGATEVFVTVENPVHYFASVTNEAFARNGLTVQGQVVLASSDPRTDWRQVSAHTTPLSVIIFVVNKKSQNHYAEQVLKMLGAEKNKQGSWASGNRVVTDWLTTKVGVPASEFRAVDGSGMSRDNRASANAFVHLLRYMWKSPWRQDFVSSMPYTGDPDSKFGNRLKQEPYKRQIYAKTGYIGGVVGLSGYVHAQSGKVYAFSFLFNRYRVGVYAVYRLQDEMLKEIVRNG